MSWRGNNGVTDVRLSLIQYFENELRHSIVSCWVVMDGACDVVKDGIEGYFEEDQRGWNPSLA